MEQAEKRKYLIKTLLAEQPRYGNMEIMKYDVILTEQAETDLRGIFEYIAYDLLAPENATGQLEVVCLGNENKKKARRQDDCFLQGNHYSIYHSG